MKKPKIKFIPFFILLEMFISTFPLYGQGQPKVQLVNINITPGELFTGESLTVSCSLKITQPLVRDCFLFLHLEGLGPGRFLNADVVLSKPTTEWRIDEKIDLGPFFVYIPIDLGEGDYQLIMGLAYPESSPLGTSYVKIPYANSEINNWTVGKIRIRARPINLNTYRDKDYSVTVEDSLNKVFPEKEYFRAEIKDNFYISCARNEYEGFQIVIIPDKQDLKGVRLEVSDFVDKDEGQIIKKDNIKLYKVGYVKTEKPYYNTPRVGYWPDPLTPLTGSFEVKKEKNQPIWINIYVPEDMPKGDYQGKVIVGAEGLKPKEIKISLRVWDFSLSKEAHLKTAFDLYEYLVDLRYPKIQNESDAEYKKRLENLKRDYYLDMLRHRINPIHNVGNPKLLKLEDGKYILDFEEFDKKVEFYRNFGQVCFGIAQEWPYGYKGDWTDKWYGFSDANAVVGVFREYGRHLEEKGWFGNAYAYIFDETFHRVKEVTSLIHKAHPKIKNLLTMTPEEGYPDVDIWCVRINNLDRLIVEKFRKEGKPIWTYVSSPTRPYPSLNLDLPSVEYRIIPWICWKYKLDGFLYWCVNWWYNKNPWEDAMTYPEQNGNGSLYYPDPEGKIPITSIRLEVLRDGLEDYEYLYILRGKLKELKNHPDGKEELIKKIEEVLEVANNMVKSLAYHSFASDKIYKLREEIAYLIEIAK